MISTHAPLAGRDGSRRDAGIPRRDFNPRAPCGARLYADDVTTAGKIFQPTRPLRGATRSLCAAGWKGEFQPTRPLRGATAAAPAPSPGKWNFNPRAPCGARPEGNISSLTQTVFQPTRPLRGATRAADRDTKEHQDFNPRAPCGARPRPASAWTRRTYFNPRAPCGARRRDRLRQRHCLHISTHAPLAGRDTVPELDYICENISTHAPLAGRDAIASGIVQQMQQISTHAPLAGRDSKSVQITMHIFAITDKFQMLLHRMPPVRAFCSFLMQENHADFGCEPPK